MVAELAWSCDFCGKSGIIVSKAGTLYCKYCRMSYGENTDDLKKHMKKYLID